MQILSPLYFQSPLFPVPSISSPLYFQSPLFPVPSISSPLYFQSPLFPVPSISSPLYFQSPLFPVPSISSPLYFQSPLFPVPSISSPHTKYFKSTIKSFRSVHIIHIIIHNNILLSVHSTIGVLHLVVATEHCLFSHIMLTVRIEILLCVGRHVCNDLFILVQSMLAEETYPRQIPCN